jgi:cytochrome c biogenesis protein CcdA
MDLLTLVSAFTYGLTSSLTLCFATCLPFYIPVLFGYGDDRIKGLMLSMGFAVGRFAGYLSLGVVAAFLGSAFIGFFNDTFPKISTLVILIFGFLTIFYGIVVLAKVEPRIFGKGRCKNYIDKTTKSSNPLIGTLFLGFVSTITPCVPVFTFLLLPFALGKIWETAIVTFAFGLGANAAFIALGIAVGFGMENAKVKFDKVKRPLEIISSGTLLVFGLFYVIWASGPTLFGWSNPSHQLPSIYDLADFVVYIFKGF